MPLFVRNIIPNSMSGETNRDAEPNIAVDPSDPRHMVITSFTYDIPALSTSPIFVSTDGGQNWVRNSIVPSPGKTGDITAKFGGTSGVLYAGILRSSDSANLILRTPDFTGPALMTILANRGSSPLRDQPFVQAGTVLGGPGVGHDRVYIGYNDKSAVAGKTATIDYSLDASTAAPPAGFNAFLLDVRATSGQDAPAIRPAVHLDGTIYVAFIGWRSGFTGDVVIRRDDGWGAGATPFAALTDPGDGLVGRRVVSGVTIPFSSGAALAQDRAGADLTIAVDPRDSRIVYLAWCATDAASTFTLHLRRSGDGGATWSSADLRSIPNGKNPVVAVNETGRVAFLYQQLTGSGTAQRWVTRLEQSNDGFASVASNDVLSTTPASSAAFVATNNNNLGDYCGLIGIGKSFFGTFSADNTPDNANFPSLVTYQRNANFGTHTLLGSDNATPVGISIDPFFVKATTVTDEEDVYVRDWTDTAASGDTGVEPSTHAVFYATSDVWNRRTDSPGAFNANDQPQNEEPGHGPGAAGDNFAFARVRRKATGVARTVTAHFLYAEFGTGSNYLDAGSTTVALPAGSAGPVVTPGHGWHLPATTSTHLCLAVEISTAQDPFIAPSLLGNTPGWWTGTDLRVLSDNNKAQRNMGVYYTLVDVDLVVRYYAIVHNGASERRDIELTIETPAISKRGLGDALVHIEGKERAVKLAEPAPLVFPAVPPGGNRWLALEVRGVRAGRGGPLPVYFHERLGEAVINGFGIALRPTTAGVLIADAARFHVQLLHRLAAVTGDHELEAAARRAATELRRRLTANTYRAFVKRYLPGLARGIDHVHSTTGSSPLFPVAAALKALRGDLRGTSTEKTVTAHVALLHLTDALTTAAAKAEGDIADIPQTLRRHDQLMRRLPFVDDSDRGLQRRAIQAYQDAHARRMASVDDYRSLLADLGGPLSRLGKEFGPRTATARALKNLAAQLAAPDATPAKLQGAHRALLDSLE